MSGDVIPLEVNPNSKISTIKEMIKSELKSKIPISNNKQIVLFDNEGNYFKDDIIIKRILKENDIINIFINITDEPPFKEEQWIKLNYSKRDLEQYKKGTKKLNPAMKFNRWANEEFAQYLARIGGNYPIQVFEGNLDDFLALPGVTDIVLLQEFNRHMLHRSNLTQSQQRNLREFRDSIEELGYDNLKYVYGAYNLYSPYHVVEKSLEFIATNKDASIVYEYSDGGIIYVYINGFKMYLNQWLGMSKANRLKLLKYV